MRKKIMWRGVKYPKAWVDAFKKADIPKGYVTMAEWAKKFGGISDLNHIHKISKHAIKSKNDDEALNRIKKNIMYVKMRGLSIGFIKASFPRSAMTRSRRYNDIYKDFIPLQEFCKKWNINYQYTLKNIDLIPDKYKIIKMINRSFRVVLVNEKMTPHTVEEMIKCALYQKYGKIFISFYSLYSFYDISRQGAHQQLAAGKIKGAVKFRDRWYVPQNTILSIKERNIKL